LKGLPRLYTGTFFMMSAANLCTVSSFSCFFLFPLYITEHGGDKADIGIVMGVMALSSVICRPWISEMIDRIGRKRSYTMGCLIMTALPLAYLLLRGDIHRSYPFLLLVRLIHGVGLAICFTSVFTYMADIIPEVRLNEGIGMFGVTGLSGMAVGPVVGEEIISHFGFSTFFLAASGLGALGLLFHLPLSESYAPGGGRSGRSFFEVLGMKKIRLISLMALLFGFGMAAYSGFVTPFASEVELRFVSLYYVAYSFAAVGTRLFGGRLADRVGELRVLPWALAFSGGGLLMLLFLNGYVVLAIAGMLAGCGHGFLFPSLNALAIRDEPIEIRGKINGVFTGGIDTGAFLGGISLGYVGRWAGYRVLFFTAGFAVLAGLWVFRAYAAWERKMSTSRAESR